MSDILLTHGFFLDEDSGEQELMKPYPPLGLLYLCAYLRREGFGVEVYDATFGSRDALSSRFAHQAGGVVGLYTTHMTRRSVLQICAVAGACGWTVVAGGPDACCYPQRYLEHGVDVVVLGEGEQALARLMEALASDGPQRLHAVRGVVFRDERGTITRTPPAGLLDLDLLPPPDRQAIDVPRYLEAWRGRHGHGSLNVSFARGCPYHCRWCSHAVFGRSHRVRSVGGCADEVEQLVAEYAPERLWYVDDVFTLNHRWLFGLRDELARRDIAVPFETITRADRLEDDRVVDALAEMGCFRVWIGSESGSDRMLQAMERGVTSAQVRRAVQRARQRGIEVGLFLMWGYEGETEEDVEATVEHVKEANADIFFSTVVYPIKGTPYYEDVEERIVKPEEWSRANEKDHRVRGRHSRDYYKHASRLLRAEVEAERLRVRGQESAAAHEHAEADRQRRQMQKLAHEEEA